MSKENNDAGEGKGLSPFQTFIKDNATGPEANKADAPEGDTPAEPEGSKKAALMEAPVDNPAKPEEKAPSSIQELVRQRQAAEDVGGDDGETHEYFTDLRKPGKGASKGDQINYVKEVGRRWEAEAKEKAKELEEARSKTFDPRDTDEWKKFEAETEEYKTQAARAKELEDKLAAVDLQYDPVFQREITEPMATEQNRLIEIFKVSKGEDAAAYVPLLQQALAAETEGEFLSAARDAISEIEPHFAHAAFEHLRNLRTIGEKQTKYLANHNETAKEFQQDRLKSNKANSDQFISKDWKRYRDTAEGSVSKTWKMLDDLGIKEISEQAKKTKSDALKWTESGLRETIETHGGVSESVAQTVALAPELLALIPLVDEAMAYIQKQNEEHENIKAQYEKLKHGGNSDTASRPDRGTGKSATEIPGSLVEFARQEGVLS